MNTEDYFFIGSGIRTEALQGGLYLLFAAICVAWLFWVFKRQSSKALESPDATDVSVLGPFYLAVAIVIVLLVFFGALLF